MTKAAPYSTPPAPALVFRHLSMLFHSVTQLSIIQVMQREAEAARLKERLAEEREALQQKVAEEERARQEEAETRRQLQRDKAALEAEVERVKQMAQKVEESSTEVRETYQQAKAERVWTHVGDLHA